MKKNLLISILIVVLLSFAACSSTADKNGNADGSGQTAANSEAEAELEKIVVGATPLPHAEILEFIKEDLKASGYALEIIEFTDYVTPNLALDEGALDANFFQHVPYMDSFAKEHNLKLVNAGGVHVEPMGAYSKKIKSIDDLADGAEVAIPNDATNGGRALLLLQKHGLIKLSDDAGLEATELDIVENPLNLKFLAIDAAQLPRTLDDVALSVINSNYALDAGFNPVQDSLIMEQSDSPYVNIITVTDENKDGEKIKALVEALQTEKVKDFIIERYQGAIVPSF